MAVIAGTRYGFSDPNNVAIDMSDTLGMISPKDVPLLQLIGKDSLSTPCTAVKHEWLEDELRPLDSANADTGEFNNTTDPLTLNVTAGHGVYFRAGDIVKVEAELMRVTTVSTDDITFARGFGGSTNAAHAGVQPIRIITNVNVQDAPQGASRTTTKSARFNYTFIYEDVVKVTSTAQALKKYVEQNEMSAQLRRAMSVAWILYERALLDSRKVAHAAGVAGAMDGILPVIATNAYAKAGAPLVEDFILTAIKDSWVAGGSISHIFVNEFQKRQLDKILDSMRMTSRGDRQGGVIVNRYESSFGDAEIVLDRNIPTDTVLLIEAGRIGFGPFTGHALSAAPVETSTRLVDAVQIIGQYTSETRNEKAHAKITGLATA
jgi:hypothetical protein